jgi:hypothetical protein
MKIKIEWISDEHECERCSAYAEGVFVKFEDGREIDMTPQAYCCYDPNYESVRYDLGQVYHAILKELGHDIELSIEDDC